MKAYVCVLVAILAMAVPGQALLGAKLALLGALRNSIGGGSNEGGYSNGGYGKGGYGNSGYARSINYNRPVYTGYNTNNGWGGQQSYGGGYASDYNRGGGGNEQIIKIIKVIVPQGQSQGYYDNYGTSSASAVSSSSSANWSPIPAPVPVQPIQTDQVRVPAPGQPLQTIQTIQGTVQVPVSAPVQVIQPPPTPTYFQPQNQYLPPTQSVYQQVAEQRPIYQQPQAFPVQVPQLFPKVQEAIRSVKVFVDGGSQQRVPAQTYGPPPPAATYVAPGTSQTGAWTSGAWNSDATANSWNNVGKGPWKSGSIWESVGC